MITCSARGLQGEDQARGGAFVWGGGERPVGLLAHGAPGCKTCHVANPTRGPDDEAACHSLGERGIEVVTEGGRDGGEREGGKERRELRE